MDILSLGRHAERRAINRLTSPTVCHQKSIQTKSGPALFTIPRVVETEQGGRVITLVAEAYPDLARPTAIEIQILTAIITQGMSEQSLELRFGEPCARNKLSMATVN